MDIAKIIKMIDEEKIDDARKALVEALMQQNCKTTYKVYNLAKQYIKKAGISRPICKTIQHKDNKQFLCDGYSLIIFKNYIKELEELPQTDENDSLDCNRIFDFYQTFTDTFTDDELLLLNNLTKYGKLGFEYVLLRDMVFRTEYLATIWKFVNNEPTQIKVNTMNIAIKTDELNILTLCCRSSDEDKEKVKVKTEEFLQQLKQF